MPAFAFHLEPDFFGDIIISGSICGPLTAAPGTDQLNRFVRVDEDLFAHAVRCSQTRFDGCFSRGRSGHGNALFFYNTLIQLEVNLIFFMGNVNPEFPCLFLENFFWDQGVFMLKKTLLLVNHFDN
jgi:hypothetical protein